ncbi:hypothetical protein CYMTET_20084, partial [Cymbomonas tetramitiformis]
MDVTCDNFDEIRPHLAETLTDCVFWAFDLEFTGLSLGRSADNLDDLQDRYEKLAECGRNFLVLQFGLSTFHWRDGKWEARTFNIYVFPASHAGYDKRFTCQTSSLRFLASCNFDFNKCVHQGVRFLPAAYVERQMASSTGAGEFAPKRDRNPIVVTSERDVAFVADLQEK